MVNAKIDVPGKTLAEIDQPLPATELQNLLRDNAMLRLALQQMPHGL